MHQLKTSPSIFVSGLPGLVNQYNIIQSCMNGWNLHMDLEMEIEAAWEAYQQTHKEHQITAEKYSIPCILPRHFLHYTLLSQKTFTKQQSISNNFNPANLEKKERGSWAAEVAHAHSELNSCNISLNTQQMAVACCIHEEDISSIAAFHTSRESRTASVQGRRGSKYTP